MRHWLDTFADFFFEGVAAETKAEAYNRIEERLRPKLYNQGEWRADYMRIRIMAVLPE
jgi:hypothetical protein